MSKVLTEYEAVRYATILELIMQSKFGSCSDLFANYKSKKITKPILMVMYEAMVYEELHGLDSLDDWYYAHPEKHQSVDQYLNLISKMKDNVVTERDFPLTFSYKLLQKHLPEKNQIVKHARFMYDRLQRLSNRIRFPKGSKADRQHDPLLAKDGFPTWDDYLAYELERILGKTD
ncbi:hypothetical protein MPK66_gp219 [Erwinia phage pEa_SNUABM_2]|uniref:Uncharacterized protein n=1 Tax=Erwinia phage pEa_SNUABM_2 TaxID=2869547 RepID=A0AAE7XPY7_9CAUD|nr:hypothetical protein MPK66_gp219 [Erwinia phage pEa_SNUABM_2]QZE59463.1 hypothetical protein pEaSNUABM2_00219 [Erwinia phage pEa_SNUABM_2]QZE59799.1 hypothetical protein pEaSNUABM39_00219 [Erwinia phage pEa_SNUABM_39]